MVSSRETEKPQSKSKRTNRNIIFIPGRSVPAPLPSLVLHPDLDLLQPAERVVPDPPEPPLAQVGLRAPVLGLLPGPVEGAQAVGVLVVVQLEALPGQRVELLLAAVVLKQGKSISNKVHVLQKDREG